jgi:hypothetical protein
VENSYLTIAKYTIFKNYAFFSTLVMLVTISITLFFFSIYHFYLISLNLTTVENSKKGKLKKFMLMINDTLKILGKEKNVDFNKYTNTKLDEDDYSKFKKIAFKSNLLYVKL